MTLRHFIRKHRVELILLVRSFTPRAGTTDADLCKWIAFDAELIEWARSEGVKI